MFEWGWPVLANYHQEVGIMGYALMADLMGEDMVMAQQGNGWFWFDYRYQVKSRYTSTSWRPYGLWNYYYTIIANVNYIIAAEETMEGPTADKNSIIGQAYAIRAYCYHNLAVMFARTYIGHENEKCVPIYTEPTSAGTQGQPRSTNEEVYKRVIEDIDKAIALLAEASPARDKSHISLNVAKALKARVLSYTAKTQQEWKAVANLAKEAQAAGTICAYD
ncbi:MAG: RagB/SusD family nutrient uptake outer membrane protein, partial [Bacteroidales bacterium]|nr:RagB/SusD family nutrient uptake outer membrane protein [Bacteroidales bacterium]